MQGVRAADKRRIDLSMINLIVILSVLLGFHIAVAIRIYGRLAIGEEVSYFNMLLNTLMLAFYFITVLYLAQGMGKVLT